MAVAWPGCPVNTDRTCRPGTALGTTVLVRESVIDVEFGLEIRRARTSPILMGDMVIT